MFNLGKIIFLISSAQEKTHEAKVGWIIWFVMFAVIIFLGGLFSFVFTGEKRWKKKISEHSDSNVRVYSFNYVKRSFYYFDKMNLTNTKTLTEEEFLSQFTATDKYLVDDWLKSIVRNDSHSDFIQADIKISKARKITSSLLEFESINRQKNTIHFNSYLLSHIYQANIKTHMRQKRERISQKYVLENIESAQKFLDRGSLDVVGAVFYFKLFRNPEKWSLKENNNKEMEEINRELILQLSHFLSKQRKIILLSPTEEMIVDISCISKIVSMTTASTIQTYLQQVLNRKAKSDDDFVALGISTGTYYNRNVQLAKEQSGKMAGAIAKGLTKERVLFYDESFFLNYQQLSRQKDEVRMIVKNATFRNYFSPTLNLANRRQDFYMLFSYPYGTDLSTFSEVSNLSKQMGTIDKLYDSLIGKVKALTDSKKERIKIATRVNYDTLNEFIGALERNKEEKIQWIPIVSETDLLTCMDDSLQIAKKFHDFTKKGYQIGLIVENSMTTLRTRILRTISYFFVPPNNSVTLTERTTDLKNIQSGYGNYRIPLVFYGLKDFEEIELGVHYGGSIFQCDELSLPSSRIEEIPTERVDQIISETKNLGPRSQMDIMMNNNI